MPIVLFLLGLSGQAVEPAPVAADEEILLLQAEGIGVREVFRRQGPVIASAG